MRRVRRALGPMRDHRDAIALHRNRQRRERFDEDNAKRMRDVRWVESKWTNSARDHDTHVTFGVRTSNDRAIDLRSKCRRFDRKLNSYEIGGSFQATNVLIEGEGPPAVGTYRLEDTVPVEKTAIVNGDLRVIRAEDFAIDTRQSTHGGRMMRKGRGGEVCRRDRITSPRHFVQFTS